MKRCEAAPKNITGNKADNGFFCYIGIMDTVVLANVLTFIGESTLFIASTRKNKKEILIFQIICMALATISSFLLKGYSGVVMGVLGIVRNILSINNIGSTLISYLFIGAAILFGILFNNNGLLGLLAIAANVSQSLFILNRKASVRNAVISRWIPCGE